MAAISNGFHPHISSLQSNIKKPQVLHTTLPCLHLAASHQKPILAYQSSSLTKITRATQASSDHNNSQPEAQPPAKSSTWKNWIIGLLLSLTVPSLRHKGSPLMALKSKVDTAVETVETVAEMVEEIAEEVEKVAEVVEDKLPADEDGKLKEAIESIEHLAKEAVHEAEIAKDVLNKVEEVEEELEEALATKSDTDFVKGKGHKKP